MVASSLIIDDVRGYVSEKVAVVYFYASHGRQSDQSVPSFLSSLARQLIERRPEAEHGTAADSVNSFLQHRDSRSQEKLCELVYKFAVLYDCVFCVVDALDEFSPDHDERTNLVKRLVQLRTDLGGVKLRICLTSRDSGRTHDLLDPFTTLRIRTTKAEMEIYLNKRMEQSTFLSSSIQKDDTLKDSILATVVQKSDLM